MRPLLLSISSGLLLAAGWPTYGFPFLLFVAFVPLLILVFDFKNSERKSGWNVLGLSYLTFFLWNIITTFWLYYSTPFGMWFAVIANSLLMAIVFLIYYKISKRISFKQGSLFLVLLWISFEYMHLHWDFSWPWLNLGNAFSEYTSWIQWYEFTGAFGGSLWIWIGNFIVFKAILLYRQHRDSGILKKGALKLALCIAIPALVSLVILKTYKASTNTMEVVILQPNIDPYNEKYDTTDKRVAHLLDSLAKTKLTPNTKLILAPETVFAENTAISQFKTSTANTFAEDLLVVNNKLNIISGISMYDFFRIASKVRKQSNPYQGGWYDDYNSAFLKNSTSPTEFYHKSKLVVGVENFPYQSLLKPILGDAMIDLGGTVAMKTTQDDRESFLLSNGVSTAPIICYESVYGGFVTGYVRNGAQFLSIITNDAWWSDTQGHQQHFSYARLRSIETRRSVARSANTGISGFIDETGAIVKILGYSKQGAIIGDVTLNEKITFYVRYGDYIARISGFVLAFLFLYAITRRRGQL